MLHMVILKHAPESCPGRPGNEHIFPCMNKVEHLFTQKNVKIVGRWADPPAHVNYFVLEAENSHLVQGCFMESGLMFHSTVEIRAVLSMD